MFSLKKIKGVPIIQYVLIISSFGLFFPSFEFLLYISIALCLFPLRFRKSPFSKKQLPFLFLMLYVLWTYCSLSYSSNIDEGLPYIEKGIPLLLVAFLGLFTVPSRILSMEKVKAGFINVSFIFLIVCCIKLLIEYFCGNLVGQIRINELSNIDVFGGFIHRTYASTVLLMGVVVLCEKMFLDRKSWWWTSLGVVVILGFIYLSGARVALFSAFVLIVVLVLYFSFKRMNKIWFFSVFVLSVLLFVVIIITSPRVKYSLWNLRQGVSVSQSFDRYTTWKGAVSIIKDNPVIGVGVGDVQDSLYMAYIAMGQDLIAKRKLNAHNQYLQIWAETGIVGLLLLIVFFVTLFYGVDKRLRIYSLCLIVIYGINFFFESMLLRNMAVFPIVFWCLLFYISDKDSMDIKKKKIFYRSPWLGLFLSAIFIVILSLLLKKHPFNSGDPRSYMSVKYIMLPYDSLPNNAVFDLDIKAVKIDKSNLFLRPDKVGEFMAFDIYKYLEDSSQNVVFTFWCYVSDDCNLGLVRSYIYNKSILCEVASYDLSRKGTWQQLRIALDDIPKYSAMGVRLDVCGDKGFNGNVIFAKPEINFTKN